jgi:hypothetical protein
MIYILDPGPLLDVIAFTSKNDAEVAFAAKKFTASMMGERAKLYSCDRGQWRQYQAYSPTAGWERCSKGNLTIKVLDAARRKAS